MAVVTMRQLLESGVHFGHQTRRWNPKMKRFIMTERNGIYIIDLQQSLAYIDRAYAFVKDTVAKGGTVMFVGTKKQAQEAIAEQATRVGMPYVNQRWLGGMLTNFQTVHQRINRLKELDEVDFDDVAGSGRTKKELLQMKRERDKLNKTLGGIREMTRTPSAVWIVDTNKEHLAVEEARKLRIPIIGILDSNCDPDLVDFPIPGNDDAIRAVGLLTRVVADAVADGLIARSGAKSERRGRERCRRAAGRVGARAAPGRGRQGRRRRRPAASRADAPATPAAEAHRRAPPRRQRRRAAEAADRRPPTPGHEAAGASAEAARLRSRPRPRAEPPRRAPTRPRRPRPAAEAPADQAEQAAEASPGLTDRRAGAGACRRRAPRPGPASPCRHRPRPPHHDRLHHQHEGVHTDMANISAADVKKLRDLTGAGMMDCKKALEEADGDFDEGRRDPAHQGRGQGREARRRAHRLRRPGRHLRRAPWSSSTPRPTSWPRTRSSSPPPSRSPTPPPRPRPPTRRPSRPSRSATSTVGETVEDLAVTDRREDRARPRRRTSTVRS